MHIVALLGVLAMSPMDLPSGPTPAALEFAHFPDRLHAFVWRNWQLVPAERLAQVVGARREDIVAIGRSMGLSGPPRITEDQRSRSHITVIRRNWHLLPYDQIEQLLGWTTEQLAFALREDDFLYVKLGNLKPLCAPLRYTPPSPEARRRAHEIADIVRADFPSGVGQLRKPLFSFVRDLSARSGVRPKPAGGGLSPRYCYSYFGLYGDPLLDAKRDPYPEGYLQRLAAAGVDGVWLQGVFTKLAPFPFEPALSEGHETRRANLRKLVQRAAKYGIRVYLYTNEPRSMPLAFFSSHPELKGAVEGEHAALCTSVPEVRRWLSDAVATICRDVPDLGGFFTITASENFTNCWSHFGAASCPRCAKRSGALVVAEVNQCVADGISAAHGRQELIAWDWGWPDEWAEEAIGALPRRAALQSVSEWSLPITRGGVSTTVGEYSISSVGPGPRATRHWAIAKKRGLKVIAKMQVAASWEMSALPYVPAMHLIAEHTANVRTAGVDGIMLGWTLGGYPSPNLDVVREIGEGRSTAEAIASVASRRYGVGAGPVVAEAWRLMSRSFAEFPFHGGVVYCGPQHMGPANLLWAKPTGYRATMVGIPYDDLDSWRAVYPTDVFVSQMRRVSEGFRSAVTLLEGVRPQSDVDTEAVLSERRIAAACASHLESTANQARYVALRDARIAAGPDRGSEAEAETRRLLEDEVRLAKELYGLQCEDPRIGFEASNQYYYVPCDLAEKVLNCRKLLAEL